jgi:hypothetical protein
MMTRKIVKRSTLKKKESYKSNDNVLSLHREGENQLKIAKSVDTYTIDLGAIQIIHDTFCGK